MAYVAAAAVIVATVVATAVAVATVLLLSAAVSVIVKMGVMQTGPVFQIPARVWREAITFERRGKKQLTQ